MDIIEKIGDTLFGMGREVAEKTKEFAETAKLKSQISTCEEVINKNYMEIGKLYYELYGDKPEKAFEKSCNAIKNAKYGVEDLQEKIRGIKEI